VNYFSIDDGVKGPEVVEVKAEVGETVLLPCDLKISYNYTVLTCMKQMSLNVKVYCNLTSGIKQLQVTWIRNKDSHILIVDLNAYSSDQRFQAVKNKNETWSLRIQNVQKRDDGIYECQLSRGLMKTWVKLQVVDKGGNLLIY